MERDSPRYAELAVTTNFSFLRGASHPQELVAQALDLGLAGIGIADRNSLAGIVRAHVFAREHKAAAQGLRVVSGARLVFCDHTPDILSFPKDRAAYARLTRLLTRGNARAQKGTCLLTQSDLLEHAQGLQLIVMPKSSWEAKDNQKHAAKIHSDLITADFTDAQPKAVTEGKESSYTHLALLDSLRAATQNNVWLAASMTYGRHMRRDLMNRRALARRTGLPLLATNDVLMHAPRRRALQDVLTSIREGVTLDAAGYRLEVNAERHLKDATEMARLFTEAPEAIAETLCFLEGINFSLDELHGDYPEELREGFATPQEALEAFTHEGARQRYPNGVPPHVRQAIAHELKLVAELDYAPYFLTVHDIMRFARSRGILCQGRGSAANSTLCFCLGITEVDPAIHDLLFERFISTERNEPPDIDVDFEHGRREEVMQYIYEHYGRARAGLTASVITYRMRSAIRETGKAFGFSEDAVSALSNTVFGHSSTLDAQETRKAGLDPTEARLAKAIELASELMGFPRHLSQHTGGFVITRSRLDETVPIANAAMEDRTTIEWDKDDLDALGILKIDVLALGMLSCLRKGFDLIKKHYDKDMTLARLPAEERAVYDMISRADTIGVFQIESRAQMSMLPRLKPSTFYDLVIEVAIVRPGPIQGDMVHPYLRRRQGLEPVSYPSKELEAVLGKTLGVPLFQEQAMKIAIVAAGFTPSEADRLRRSMATFKHVGTISTFQDKMVEGMAARGYPRDFALRCFKQIEGFGTYGFPESHAASFALLVYASAWMKCRYPDVFACALLNAQPMGFYAPAQIVRDAREHGISIEEVDVNFSDWDATLEPHTSQPDSTAGQLHPRHASMQSEILSTHKLRLGFRQIKGLCEADMKQLVALRKNGYDSIRDLWLRTRLSPGILEILAQADVFGSLGLDRREALWAVRGLNRTGDKDDLPLLQALSWCPLEADAKLPPMPPGEQVIEDYRHLSLSLKGHPVAFVRERLDHDDFGLNQSKIMNVIDSKNLERDAGGKPGSTFPHPALTQNKICRAEELAILPPGGRVSVAGLVLVRQRPGSAKGVIFLTLEDETGIANVIVWPKILEIYRPAVIGARFIAVTGRLQNEAGVIHVIMERAKDLTFLLSDLNAQGSLPGLARAVKRPNPPSDKSKKSQASLFGEPQMPTRDPSPAAGIQHALPKGRNFQ
jgi:error-prone DNA polymerase